jgi:hypothetical protein
MRTQNKNNNKINKNYTDIIEHKLTFADEFININILNESQINDMQQDIDNKMIIFDTNQYLEKIILSYNKNIYNIMQQFKSDHTRSEVYLDDKKIYDSHEFINKILKYASYKVNLCDQAFGLDIIILMLCTQASLAFSFILMNKLYTNHHKGKHVTAHKSKYIVNIKNPDVIDLKLDAIYNVKDVNKNIITTKINVVTNITIIRKKKQYEFCKWSIISWNFV